MHLQEDGPGFWSIGTQEIFNNLSLKIYLYLYLYIYLDILSSLYTMWWQKQANYMEGMG